MGLRGCPRNGRIPPPPPKSWVVGRGVSVGSVTPEVVALGWHGGCGVTIGTAGETEARRGGLHTQWGLQRWGSHRTHLCVCVCVCVCVCAHGSITAVRVHKCSAGARWVHVHSSAAGRACACVHKQSVSARCRGACTSTAALSGVGACTTQHGCKASVRAQAQHCCQVSVRAQAQRQCQVCVRTQAQRRCQLLLHTCTRVWVQHRRCVQPCAHTTCVPCVCVCVCVCECARPPCSAAPPPRSRHGGAPR